MNWIEGGAPRAAGIFFAAALLSIGLSFHLRNVPILFFALGLLGTAAMLAFPASRNVAVVLTSVALSLCLAELIAMLVSRVAFEEAVHDPSSGDRKDYFQHTDVGILATPGVHTSRELTTRGDVIYDVAYTIGEDGFRKTRTREDADLRVNFFGGSFTFGEGLDDDETLPFYVSELMPMIAVRNFGFHGSGAHNALAILQSDRDTRGQVNFFLTAPWHATRSACKPGWSAGSPRYSLVGDTVVRNGFCESLRPSTLGDVLDKVLSRSNLYQLTKRAGHVEATDEDYELYLALVREMHALSKARNQKFIVGFIKAEDRYFKDSSYTNEKLFSALSDASDAIVDVTLAPRYEDLDRSLYIHPLNKHPSALANSRRAQLIVPVIETELRQ